MKALIASTAALAALALAGCGGSHSTGAATTPNSPSSAQLQSQFVQVVKAVSPSVVQIETPSGLGSGIVYDGRGNIVTNAHVVADSGPFKVTLAGGAQHGATLVGTYPQNDIAVVRLNGAKPRPAAFADSSKIQVGDFALAIGNPLGLRSSVTEGIVSSVGRTVPEGNGVVLPSAIQTSAPINPGNSGGALVNLSGAVIGIPTLAATDPEFGGAQAAGIGFAIPSNTVRNIAKNLITSGKVTKTGRAYPGVVVSTLVGGGVLVENVQNGGPAAKAGIQPGDVIAAVAGQDISSADELTSVMQTLAPGQTVPVVVVDQTGQQSTVNVKLGAQPGR